MVTRARAQVAARVALAADDERTATEVARLAAERGVPFERLSLESAVAAPVGAIAYAPAALPDAARAADLARLCAAAAENRRPIVLFAPASRGRGRAHEEQVAALAYLRAYGVVPVEDPDAWFETCVLLAAYGAPAGPRLAIVAPPGGWLALQAAALGVDDPARVRLHAQREDEEPEDLEPTDLLFVDGRLDAPGADRAGRAIVVPVVARGELMPADGRTVIVGLRAALAAADAAARHGERVRQGLGPAPTSDVKRLRVDRARADKALAAPSGDRLGDHETKLLLSAYGATVTRQAVANSPSAAVRYATTLGFPVEIKVWDPAQPAELDGGAVIGDAGNPPDVRRAFASAATGAGLEVGVPVIVRATPPPGREVRASIERLGPLGWTVLARLPGSDTVLAAPAPLRRADADELAAVIPAARAGDAPPDRAALADLFVRAAHAAVDHDAVLDALELGRIVVARKGEGATVVDARVRLRRRKK